MPIPENSTAGGFLRRFCPWGGKCSCKNPKKCVAQLEKDPDEDREWLQLQEEVQQMEEQKAELETLVQQVEADLEALKQKLRNEDTDQSYFLEVYDALTKGLNDVKGYISGN